MSVGSKSCPNVFDQYVEDYEAACSRGLALSGERRDYFARKRVHYTHRRCPAPSAIRTIIDFGCGLGHTVPLLLESFPGVKVFGVDTAAAAIRAAEDRYGSPRVSFVRDSADSTCLLADLVYCNGVFHHIVPAAREAAAKKIFDWLRPGGFFALWENNPWNPGTRLVMSCIPFDRDALPLSYLEAERILRSVGFRVSYTSFHFIFPSLLKPFRRIEPYLERLPLGAQYCVLACKP